MGRHVTYLWREVLAEGGAASDGFGLLIEAGTQTEVDLRTKESHTAMR